MNPHFDRYPLIFNPYARSERGKRALQFIMAEAPRFAIYATKGAEEAERLARHFAEEETPVVVAAGGDGTLNPVVRGLLGSRTALGVLPTGTMNVFAREMGIQPDQLSRALAVIDENNRVEVDIFNMNGTPFLQMAGVGFDAQVIEETTWESKKLLGPLAYLLSAVKVLGETPAPMRVICDDGREVEGVCLLVGNGSLYGGQFRLFKEASNSDQLLDVVVFKESGYRFVMESLRGLARGGVTMDDACESIEYVQASGFRVECEEEVPVEVDGELWGRSREVVFERGAATLGVMAPNEPMKNGWLEMLRVLRPW